MIDAISRSALREKLNKFKLSDDCMKHEWAIQAADDVAKYTIAAIKNAPALDVAPVVHARWIMNHFGAKCSNCLRLYCMEPSWSEKIKHMPPTWIYCPNCGARMDGEAE